MCLRHTMVIEPTPAWPFALFIKKWGGGEVEQKGKMVGKMYRLNCQIPLQFVVKCTV